MEHFPMKKILKLDEMLSTKGQRTTWGKVREAETQSCKNNRSQPGETQQEISPDRHFWRSEGLVAHMGHPSSWDLPGKMSPPEYLVLFIISIISSFSITSISANY